METNWLGVGGRLVQQRRKERQRRITEWKETVGPPHEEIVLAYNTEYQETIGFWKVGESVVRIRKTKSGYDPIEWTEITESEIDTLVNAFGHFPGVGG